MRRFPMHPSYEEREGVPDRSFPSVSPRQGERIAAAWARLIAGSAELRRAQIVHLHHLTPMHEAAATVLPRRPDRDAPARHRAQDAGRDRTRRGRGWPGPARALVGRAHGRGRAPRRCDDRDLPPPARRGRAAARAGPGDGALAPRRRRRPALRRAAIGRRRAASALARLARARPPGLGRGERHAGEHPLRRGRGRRRVLRRDDRRAATGADVRRPLPRVQARAAARAGVRPRPGQHVRPGSARDLGRRARRMGGRASAQRRHSRGRQRRLLRRVARPRRSSARPRLRGLLRRAVHGRAVRTRLPRGDVLRAARRSARSAAGRRASSTSCPASRTGGSSPRTTRRPWPRRWCERSRIPSSASDVAASAARHVRAGYSWDGLAGRCTQLYENVAAARRA